MGLCSTSYGLFASRKKLTLFAKLNFSDLPSVESISCSFLPSNPIRCNIVTFDKKTGRKRLAYQVTHSRMSFSSFTDTPKYEADCSTVILLEIRAGAVSVAGIRLFNISSSSFNTASAPFWSLYAKPYCAIRNRYSGFQLSMFMSFSTQRRPPVPYNFCTPPNHILPVRFTSDSPPRWILRRTQPPASCPSLFAPKYPLAAILGLINRPSINFSVIRTPMRAALESFIASGSTWFAMSSGLSFFELSVKPSHPSNDAMATPPSTQGFLARPAMRPNILPLPSIPIKSMPSDSSSSPSLSFFFFLKKRERKPSFFSLAAFFSAALRSLVSANPPSRSPSPSLSLCFFLPPGKRSSINLPMLSSLAFV